MVELTTLSNLEYCVIEDPLDVKTGKNRNGAEVLI